MVFSSKNLWPVIQQKERSFSKKFSINCSTPQRQEVDVKPLPGEKTYKKGDKKLHPDELGTKI
jgi:hypothetical protein